MSRTEVPSYPFSANSARAACSSSSFVSPASDFGGRPRLRPELVAVIPVASSRPGQPIT